RIFSGVSLSTTVVASRVLLTTFQRAQQPAWRQRNHTMTAVLARENVLQGLRHCEAKTMRRQVSVSQALNRHSIETLRLDIQIEEANSEKFRQPCANRGLADAADAGEEDAHVAPFGESVPILVSHG